MQKSLRCALFAYFYDLKNTIKFLCKDIVTPENFPCLITACVLLCFYNSSASINTPPTYILLGVNFVIVMLFGLPFVRVMVSVAW